MKTSSAHRPLAALAVAGVLFGLTVPLTKVALGWLGPAWLAVVRFGVAAPLLAWIGRARLRSAFSARVVAWGGIGYGGTVLLQNVGVERTSVGHAALLFGAVPALVAVIAALAGRGSGGARTWLGPLVALGGVAFVTGSGGSGSLAGDGLILLAAIVQAGFLVAQSGLLEDRDPIAVTALQMAASALVALPAAATGGLPAAPTTGGAQAAVLALIVAGTVVPFALFAFGQARVRPDVAGAFVNLEPLVGAAVAVLAFGDAFGPAQALGTAAILAGIAISSLRRADSGDAATAPATLAGA